MALEQVMVNKAKSSNSSEIDKLEEEIKALEAEQAKALAPEEEETTEEETAEETKPEDNPDEQETKKDDDKKLSAEEETFKKRYGDLRRHLQEKEKEWQAQLERVQAAPTERPTSEEDLKAWVEANPEIASIIESIADKKAEDRFKEAEVSIKNLDEERFKLQREKAEANIRKAHKDYDDLSNDDKFHEWAAEQPKVIQAALYDDPDDWQSVIRVIDMYKADKGLNKEAIKEAERNASKAVDTKGDGSKPQGKKQTKWSESKVANLSIDQYVEFESEIEEAMRKGEFIYDMR